MQTVRLPSPNKHSDKIDRRNTMQSAEEKLKAMLDWASAPTLNQGEIEGLLAASAIADSSGRGPEAEDWEPAFDLNLAAAMGWAIKAARAAATTETAPDSVNVTSRIFENCLKLARHYSARRAAAVNYGAVKILS